MTTRQLSLSLLAIFTFISLKAQAPSGQKTTLAGSVKDAETGSVVEYATVSAYGLPDSSLVSGGVSDLQGNFNIEVPSDKQYYLEVSFIGYDTKQYGPFTAQNKQMNIGAINIGADAELLGEVEVIAEKSSMSLKLDKRVFTVGKDLANTGGSAADILENIPSVEVDIDGNVSLRGSGNVKILIDGKPSGLTAANTTEALEMLQGSQIERVEIVTNPSAKYDAEGEVGIINIILRKEGKKGVNGLINVDAGWPTNLGLTAQLTYRTPTYSVFGSYGLSYRKRPGEGYYYQEDYDGADTSVYETFRDHERGGLNNTFRIGGDLYFNKYNTITLSGMYNLGDDQNITELEYVDYDKAGNIIGNTSRYDEEQESEENVEFDLMYQRTFEEKDKKFDASLKWIRAEDIEESDILEQDLLGSEADIMQTAYNLEFEETWLGEMNYVEPIGKEGKVEFGSKASFRTITNEYEVQEMQGGEFVTLPGFEDKYNYQENIYALYGIVSNSWGKFSWQLGLRAEMTDISTESEIQNVSVDKSYIDPFPTIHTSYEFNEENTIQLSYSRRISRPWFRSLLPFSNYTDSRNFREGNPDLDPEYTNSFELGYLKYWKSGSLLSSLYYRYTTGVEERITTLEDDIFITKTVNLSDEHNVGIELSLSQDLTKWWSVNAGLNLFYFERQGEYEGVLYESSDFTGNGRLMSKWKVGKNVDIQGTFFYVSPSQSTQGTRSSMYGADLGASWDIFKGNGTLSLNIRDLFNTRQHSGETFGNDFYRYVEFQWASRQVNLGFSYRINQKKNKWANSGSMNSGGDMDGF